MTPYDQVDTHMIDELNKKVIRLIQGDLPVEDRPFAVLAEQAGIGEEDFIERVRNLKKQGILRRFGATLRHQKAGYDSNAMVAWLVPDERVDEVGEALAKFREVTHCYQRMPQGDWLYNLFSMVHAGSREQCREIAEKMSVTVGIKDYILLFSEKEFKKTSMEYF
jgi:DNA-binding Lrp family transcriptional regulator